jgi:hypothetical protein
MSVLYSGDEISNPRRGSAYGSSPPLEKDVQMRMTDHPGDPRQVVAPHFEPVDTPKEVHLTPAGLIQPFTRVVLRPTF